MGEQTLHLRNVSYEVLGELPDVPVISATWTDEDGQPREARGFLTALPDGTYQWERISGDMLPLTPAR